MNDRPRRRRPALLLAALGAAAALAGCAAAAPVPAPSGASPGLSAAPPATSSPAGGAISREDAVATVLALDPSFAGIGPLDPGVIGQSAWYEVLPGTVGWRVVVTKGWGDCPAGCINRHTWTYEVDGSGSVRLVEEAGDPLPDDASGGGADGSPAPPPAPIPTDGGPWIAGRAVAGPVCPVERVPPDPACADRPVPGAVIVVRGAAGAEVARVTTAADGTFLVAVPGGGTWSVEARPVEGILGTPAAMPVEVPDGPAAWVAVVVSYDTGIR